MTYTYDGDGERVKKSSGTIYWGLASNEPLAEGDLSGNVSKEFIFFGGKRMARLDLPSGAVHYYFSDHLGSSNVVTNSTGSTLEEESDFYPFGGERVLTDLLPDQRYKFTGKERDTESNLDYFAARYYSSNLGRFITPDWAAAPTAVPYADFGDPQSLNLYGYVRNNPLSRADADGHCPLCIGFILGGAVGATEILYQTGKAYFTGKGHIPTNQETADKLLKRSLQGMVVGAAYQGARPSPPAPNGDNGGQPGSGNQSDGQQSEPDTGSGPSPQNNESQPSSTGQADSKPYDDTPENNQRMTQGKPPIGKDGYSVERHHDQENPGATPEDVTRTDHRLGPNFKQNHPNTGQEPSNRDRNQDRRDNRQYWKDKSKPE